MLEFELELEPADQQAFIRHVVAWRGGWQVRLGQGLLSGLIGGATAWSVLMLVDDAAGGCVVSRVLVLALVIGWFIVQRLVVHALRPNPCGFVLGAHRYRLDDEGIEVTGTDHLSRHGWGLVESVVETGDHLFLYLDRAVALILPKAELSRLGVLEPLRELLARNAADALTGPRRPSPSAVQVQGQGQPRERRPSRVLAWLCGTALMDWVERVSFPRPLLVLIALGIVVAADLLYVPTPRDFLVQGVLALMSSVAILMGLVLAVLVKLGRPRELVAVLGDLVAGLLLPLAALLAWRGTFADFDQNAWWGQIGWAGRFWWLWVAAVTASAIARRTEPSGVRWQILVLACGLTLWLAAGWIGERPLWWHYLDEEGPEEEINIEDTYYRQGRLVRDALAPLAPQRPGVTDLYFVGFAPYGEQEVFIREQGYISDLFERRFDAAGRSVILLNHAATLESVPMANAPNLREVLNGLAEIIDPDEDLVFLYLSSHGSSHGELSGALWPLEPNGLTDKALRAMLDEAGIRWRVAVISGCYSGSFIARMEDPGTLLITAADRDRTSFGCSDDAELTDFAAAYFKGQLEHGHSFIAAFEGARQDLEAREREEKRKPSRPQIRVGDEIAPVLERLEGRLSSGS